MVAKLSKFTLALAGLSLLSASQLAVAQPHPDNLDLHWQVVDHGIGENIFLGSLTITNNGTEPLSDSGWALYFSSVRPPASVLPSGDANGDYARQHIAAQNLSLDNADVAKSGDYFVLKPQPGFVPIQPGQSREIEIIAQYWQMLKNDSPSGFHISYDGQTPQAVLVNVTMDPSDPKQTTQASNDTMPVQTTALRFTENTTALTPLALQHQLVPQPYSVEHKNDEFLTLMSQLTGISAPSALATEAAYLQTALGDILSGSFAINGAAQNGPNHITLQLDAQLDTNNDGQPDAGGYRLEIDAFSGITITGRDAQGVFYAIQTLRQLIPTSVYKNAVNSNTLADNAVLPASTILDAPRFAYRGMMLDVSRNFQSLETVFKLLDLMAFYKLNKFEINVANDEGWRLEIPGLPELTEFGAKRGHDLEENTMLHTFMGAANEFAPGDGIDNKPADKVAANLGTEPQFQGFEIAQQNFLGKGWGYYSVAEFQEILQYAADRHIDVIIEYDFPAHARAAIKAMEYRYNKYKDTDPIAANQYRLIDPLDESQYYTPQFYTDNFINPALEGTFTFLNHVVRETRAMYDAVPDAKRTRLHGGGDELPHLGANEWWAKSPAVQANPATAGKTDAELFDYFFTRWKDIINSHGFDMATWGDVLSHNGTGNVDYGDIYPVFWNNVWGWGNEHQAYKFANQGYKVVLAHATNMYLDLAYNKHPDEVGYHWAGYTDTKKTFTYRPFNIYANAESDKLGNPVPWGENWLPLSATGKQNIDGIQAQLFGENQKSPEILDYMTFPKLLGAAERAWVQTMPAEGLATQQAWDTFANTLGQHALPLLDYYQVVDIYGQIPHQHGVNYRIPLPGGAIENGKLVVNTRFAGMNTEYSLDQGATWHHYQQPVPLTTSASVQLRTVSDSGRVSRVATLSE
ncbi:beta-hexosaminidase [Pseudoalteromonas sp. SW0106-04]|uniref:family 20 glycosylhydrolase n=1 Tax=Pseudoalteromonas sp. SW0106-04 TaxID=1702169 RepID=UPI0006B5BEEA|nr:family 20 glycosylhydrolase [Pseudoalteromonas sp. SW0106-04]GAP75242.1 beta-hexosaminidase [Pseudoalteromonas sp. SW0106-04]